MNVPFHIFLKVFLKKFFLNSSFMASQLISKTSDTISILWKAGHWPIGANGVYRIYYKASNGKEEITTSEENQKTLVGLQAGEVYSIKVKISTTKGDSPWSDTRYVTTEIIEVPNNDKLKFMEAPNKSLKYALGVSKLHMISSTHQHKVSEIWAKEKRQQESIKVSCIQPKHMCSTVLLADLALQFSEES